MVGWRRALPSETTSKIKGRDGARESGQSASLIAPLERCAQRPHCDIRLRLFHRLMRRAPRNGVTPVMLPPGRFKLTTSPSLTGSEPAPKTMGMVVVANFAVDAATVLPADVRC